jgi:hypothetical protein
MDLHGSSWIFMPPSKTKGGVFSAVLNLSPEIMVLKPALEGYFLEE